MSRRKDWCGGKGKGEEKDQRKIGKKERVEKARGGYRKNSRENNHTDMK